MTNLKTIVFEFKRKELILKKYIICYISKEQWPFKEAFLTNECKIFIVDLQKKVAQIAKQEKQQSFFLINKFSFSIVNRTYCIQKTNKKSLRNNKNLVKLLNQTKYYKIKKTYEPQIQKIYTPKFNRGFRLLSVLNILDNVLQIMFLSLVKPFYETIMPNCFYGYCKDGTSTVAIAQLNRFLNKKWQRKVIVKFNFVKFFHEINISFLQRIKVPVKFEFLKQKWIKSFVTSLKIKRVYDSSLSNLFNNIVLSGVYKTVFKEISEKFILADIKRSYSIHAKLICFCNNVTLMFDYQFVTKVLQNISCFLEARGLQWSKNKLQIFTKSIGKRFEFEYGGYFFYYFPQKASKKLGNFLIKISYTVLKNHKQKLKQIFNNNLNLSVAQLIRKLNFTITSFVNYYSFCSCYKHLSWIDYYVFNKSLRFLKKKLKKKLLSKILEKYYNKNWKSINSYKKIGKKVNSALILKKHVKIKSVIQRVAFWNRIIILNYYLYKFQYFL